MLEDISSSLLDYEKSRSWAGRVIFHMLLFCSTLFCKNYVIARADQCKIVWSMKVEIIIRYGLIAKSLR